MILARYAFATNLGRFGPLSGAVLLAACGGAQPALVSAYTASDGGSIGPAWTMRALYSFKGDPDGEGPKFRSPAAPGMCRD